MVSHSALLPQPTFDPRRVLAKYQQPRPSTIAQKALFRPLAASTTSLFRLDRIENFNPRSRPVATTTQSSPQPQLPSMPLPIAIIYGVGKKPGLGHSLAKAFMRTHRVAIVSRSVSKLQPIAKELQDLGGDVKAFGAEATPEGIAQAFSEIEEAFGDRKVTLGIWNAATRPAPKSFLDVADAELDESAMVNVRAPAAFARALLPLFLRNPLPDAESKAPRGVLLFTGATSSLRGGNGFSAFASGKFGLRAVAQSIAREFGPQGVHAGHVIIDGLIDFEPQVSKTTVRTPSL